MAGHGVDAMMERRAAGARDTSGDDAPVSSGDGGAGLQDASVSTANTPRAYTPNPSAPNASAPNASAAGVLGDTDGARGGVEARHAWAQLWFAMQRGTWSTLAVVPADPAMSALEAARALATAGHTYRAGAVKLINATRAEARDIRGIVAAAAEAASAGMQVVVAVASPLANPAAIAIARAVDAAVLVVPLGEATLATARRTVESIGREYFSGSVAVRPHAARHRSTRA